MGSIPIAWSRDLLAEPGSVTIVKDAAGPCFAIFVVEAEGHQLQPNGKAAGIDLGLASLAVTSDGEKDRPAQVPSLRLKADAQAEPRPEPQGDGLSRNRQKARLPLAKAHATVADKRLDHLHKLRSRLSRENRTVVLEDPNVAGMVKNHKPACSVADAGWRLPRMLLESKARMDGGEVKIISRWQPVSQTCSTCGHRDGKKSLAVRAWRCSACGTEHHRDLNAARNILAAGLGERQNACGAESKTGVPASGSEAGTHLNQEAQ